MGVSRSFFLFFGGAVFKERVCTEFSGDLEVGSQIVVGPRRRKTKRK
jgi:hypothetical protein